MAPEGDPADSEQVLKPEQVVHEELAGLLDDN
jgi:hypothetical protein